MSQQSYWEQRIRSDLAAFVDPGTLLEIERVGSVLDAKWTQRRRSALAQFVVRDVDGIYVRYRGRELDYRSFFASEDMADIAGIAKTTGDILGSGLYVDTKATTDDQSVNGPALELISSRVRRKPGDDDLTSFVMVTGEAGAGKTSVLKELVRRQSRAYLGGSGSFVYLYVNAQGRALARFNEALATELNELRVALPHHAVAPLVRLGLIVPVIDGFDELLGVGGYDDAFSSISSFVQDLDGMGAIVASARSTYYEQEFLSRATKSTVNSDEAWKLSSVAVEGWGLDERESYVRSKLPSSDRDAVEDVLRKLNRVFSGQNEPLASKPLFVARATDFLLDGLLTSEDGALLERLVDAFVLREQREKLLKKSGASILAPEQIKSLCSDIAEEMWNLGTRELDRGTVRELAELAMYDEHLAVAEKNTVIDRVPNLAFLQPGESAGSVSFEHEIFFDYFLASRIAAAIRLRQNSLGLLLSRSAMPESLAENIAIELQASADHFTSLLTTLSVTASRTSPRQQLVRENAGRIVGELLKGSSAAVSELNLGGFVFPGSKLHGVILNGVFLSNCEFRRCDLTATRFSECTAEVVVFELPLIDEKTVLDINGVGPGDFSGLRAAEGAGVRVVYEPHEVIELLAERGLPSVQEMERTPIRGVAQSVIKVIDRLTRAYAKCNPICVQDDYLSPIFRASEWPELERLATETGVLKKEVRAANGPRRDFLRRLVRPEDIVSGLVVGADVPEQVVRFWQEVERVFPR